MVAMVFLYVTVAVYLMCDRLFLILSPKTKQTPLYIYAHFSRTECTVNEPLARQPIRVWHRPVYNDNGSLNQSATYPCRCVHLYTII